MENIEKSIKVRNVCQNCGKYNRCTKKCGNSGRYTARKNTCENFKEGK